MSHNIEPIGYVDSPFKQKFGVPRQPGLVPNLEASIIIQPPYSDPEAFEGLEQFSHIWVQFQFHQNGSKWNTKVRPPRLGGNQKIGVFASRSPFRPNQLGLSLVKLLGIESRSKHTILRIEAGDLLDKTPVYDLKPYLPYADSVETSLTGYVSGKPELVLKVQYDCEESVPEQAYAFRSHVESLIALDPRPAYKGDMDHKTYSMRFSDWDISWRVDNDVAWISQWKEWK